MEPCLNLLPSPCRELTTSVRASHSGETLDLLVKRLTSVPGSSYGESVFLAAQTSAIGVLVIAFTKGKPSALLFGALYAGIIATILVLIEY